MDANQPMRRPALPEPPRSANLHEYEIAQSVVHTAERVHRQLGPGLIESVYGPILAHEIEKAGVDVIRRVPVSSGGLFGRFDDNLLLDLVVGEKVVVEWTSADTLTPAHKEQLRADRRPPARPQASPAGPLV